MFFPPSVYLTEKAVVLASRNIVLKTVTKIYVIGLRGLLWLKDSCCELGLPVDAQLKLFQYDEVSAQSFVTFELVLFHAQCFRRSGSESGIAGAQSWRVASRLRSISLAYFGGTRKANQGPARLRNSQYWGAD